MDFLGRKGILFSMISLLVAAFFIIIFSADLDLPLDAATETVSFRVTLLDRYQESWEEFIGSALRASSYRSFAGMIQDINETAALYFHFDETKTVFKQCLLNGTINRTFGGHNGKICPGVGDSDLSFAHLLDEIVNISKNNMGVETTYEIKYVNIYQNFPFHIYVTINVSYRIKDSYAFIEKNITIEELVPIEGLVDPLAAWAHASGAAGRARKIVSTDIKPSEWNDANFSSFVNNSEYRYHQDGPSFLNRMFNPWSTSDCCGIETVLSISKDGVIKDDNRSFIDHHYFDHAMNGVPLVKRFDCNDIFTVTLFSNYWRNDIWVDQEHLVSFNVTPTSWLADTCS